MKEKKTNYQKNFSFKEFFNKYGIRFLGMVITSGICLAIFLGVRGINNVSILDSLMIAGSVSLIVSGFSFVTNHAFFDIFAYNGVRFINFCKGYKDKNMYGTYEYTESKKAKRNATRFIPLCYLASGALYFLTYLIVYLILFL